MYFYSLLRISPTIITVKCLKPGFLSSFYCYSTFKDIAYCKIQYRVVYSIFELYKGRASSVCVKTLLIQFYFNDSLWKCRYPIFFRKGSMSLSEITIYFPPMYREGAMKKAHTLFTFWDTLKCENNNNFNILLTVIWR